MISLRNQLTPISRSCQLVFSIVIIVHSPKTALLHTTFDRIFWLVRRISRYSQSETFLDGSNWNSSRARIDLCPILDVLCRRACLPSPPLPSPLSLHFQLLQLRYSPLDLEHFGTNVPIFLPPSPRNNIINPLWPISPKVYVTYPSIILPYSV